MRGDALAKPRCESVFGEGFRKKHFALPEVGPGDVEEIQYSPKNQHEEKDKMQREEQRELSWIVFNIDDLSPKEQDGDHREKEIKADRTLPCRTHQPVQKVPAKRRQRLNFVVSMAQGDVPSFNLAR